jgi:hypothetical protein
VTGWEEFGIVVAGSVVATLILGAANWLWRRSQRPVLEIECGDGFDFERRVGNTDAAVAPMVEEHRAVIALAKFLRVRETKPRSGARSVVVRIKDIDPAPPRTKSPVELKWLDSQEANDIRPHGHKSVFVELVIFYVTEQGDRGWRTTPTIFDHASEAEFTVELMVRERKYSETRFRIENPWQQSQIQAWPDSPDWPPKEIAYPTIHKVTST